MYSANKAPSLSTSSATDRPDELPRFFRRGAAHPTARSARRVARLRHWWTAELWLCRCGATGWTLVPHGRISRSRNALKLGAARVGCIVLFGWRVLVMFTWLG